MLVVRLVPAKANEKSFRWRIDLLVNLEALIHLILSVDDVFDGVAA